jgi:hypothetical protein
MKAPAKGCRQRLRRQRRFSRCLTPVTCTGSRHRHHAPAVDKKANSQGVIDPANGLKSMSMPGALAR